MLLRRMVRCVVIKFLFQMLILAVVVLIGHFAFSYSFTYFEIMAMSFLVRISMDTRKGS